MIPACAFFVLLAQTPAPEDCLAFRKAPGHVSVEYQGKTYLFREAVCRDQFLSDPERYSQLYDALLEMHRQGIATEAAQPSLVPS